MTTTQHFGGSDRSAISAMRRGFAAACPACGEAGLYHRYLKVNDHCTSCQEALHHQRADDAPPYFTMFVVGHLIVPASLLLERFAAPPLWLHMLLWLPLTVALSLLLLPRIKGALVGLQWALRMHGFGGEPD